MSDAVDELTKWLEVLVTSDCLSDDSKEWTTEVKGVCVDASGDSEEKERKKGAQITWCTCTEDEVAELLGQMTPQTIKLLNSAFHEIATSIRIPERKRRGGSLLILAGHKTNELLSLVKPHLQFVAKHHLMAFDRGSLLFPVPHNRSFWAFINDSCEPLNPVHLVSKLVRIVRYWASEVMYLVDITGQMNWKETFRYL